MAAELQIHERILADLQDGVLTLDLEGRLITLNPAAARLLDLVPAEVTGQTYAEVFLLDEAFEPLNEVLLQALYEPAVTHEREVVLSLPAGIRDLMVRTTLLRGEAEDPGGVIVLLADISGERKRRKLKRLFGSYIDPRIVERLIDQADQIDEGSRQTATIAFLDLQGFTRLAERLAPSDIVAFLNAYLEEMSAPIGANQGVTDKYIGDGIMAFWSPVFAPAGDPAVLACRAALAQRAKLPDLRERIRREFKVLAEAEAIEIRCGIATGEVIAGSLGPQQARTYTVIGDAVNLAARLEAANKRLGTRILVSEATHAQAADRFAFRPHGTIELPGRARTETVFELLDER
ncbi:adenylate/guanylate cyclase domain-containing protein [Geminicoccus roseus]|uniref:adenylate/guanylate cyclase domain-containing protein n=1 Tax=Geminicoccus roseus TaxID=404900 RepID=UPI0003FF35D2|nr:adenylate/guanylate cyclase domain-containing protein [Geminicoccus roseus]